MSTREICFIWRSLAPSPERLSPTCLQLLTSFASPRPLVADNTSEKALGSLEAQQQQPFFRRLPDHKQWLSRLQKGAAAVDNLEKEKETTIQEYRR